MICSTPFSAPLFSFHRSGCARYVVVNHFHQDFRAYGSQKPAEDLHRAVKENAPMSGFALIGAAGFIAPRHMRAIRDTGHVLAAAFDPNDSVGVIDSFFPDAHFFTEFERFDRHIDKLRRQGQGVDFMSICSPNYLHDAHIRFALRSGAHAICEKPLVLNPGDIDALAEFERDADRTIWTVLQLRHHEAVRNLKAQVAAAPADKIFDVDLTYLTARGNWYHSSWKSDPAKSGGVAANIGVHFFDMLSWVFGPQRRSVVHLRRSDAAAGYLELERARVRWFLSINAAHLPESVRAAGQRTFRALSMDGAGVEFSEGFADLHTTTYAEIFAGRGSRLEDARQAIETVYAIRTATPVGAVGERHPFCDAVLGGDK
jgi:UDP-N-acetyl-2-amino-2-deoxyglucuronate dehydrogenase